MYQFPKCYTLFLLTVLARISHIIPPNLGFPGGSDGKESASSEGDPDLISGLGRSPGEGNENSLK